jgi:hypothetical protein
MIDFFYQLRMVEGEPHDELADNGTVCLAEPGNVMQRICRSAAR